MLLLFLPALVHAHAVPFAFVAPVGAANRADGGIELVWVDGNVGEGTASVLLSAVRPSWVPWSRVAPGAELSITPVELAIESPVDAFTWDTANVPVGCWQPIARVQDPVEGVITHVGVGLVTVVQPGGITPPSVWVSTQRGEGGTYWASVEVDPPEALPAVELTLERPDGSVRLSSDGGATAPLDLHGFAPGAWYLHATVSTDAGTCDAWAQQPVFVPEPSVEADGGGTLSDDAGEETPSGAGNAMPSDAGLKPIPPRPVGCGCGAAPSWVLAVCVVGLCWRRSRGRWFAN